MVLKKKTAQKGSALIYILIAIALLAALTATFMDDSSQQTTSQNAFNTVTDLNTQINFIRSAIQECVLTYPQGDASIATAFTPPYPFNPGSAYFSAAPCSCQATPATNNAASLLRCPGNPGNSNQHAVIFGGSSGKFLPPPPKLFTEWQYFNGADGVFFYTRTDKTDSYLATALTKLDDQFSECEADVIVTAGSAWNMTTLGASGPNCPANNRCFRIWLIAQPQNIYQDAIETAACP